MENPNVAITGKLTRFAKGASVLLAITALAGVMIALTAHGLASGIGALTAVSAGSVSLASEVVYMALHIFRDLSKKSAREVADGFRSSVYLQDLESEIATLKAGSRKISEKGFEVNGKRYMVELLKGVSGIKRIILSYK